MIIEGYKTERKLYENDHSELYIAKSIKEEDGGLNYIIKIYSTNLIEEIAKSDSTKEMHISQLLENHSPFSVSIPILKKIVFGGKICLLMQQKKSGKFLKEIYEGSKSRTLWEILEITERILFSLNVLHNFVWEGKKDMILHLDLHPGNIFIENYEPGMSVTVKFIDFSNSYEERITDSIKDVIPTPSGHSSYSAPELKDEDLEKLCEGTDLYSVASIMFWMMTGKIFGDDVLLADEIERYGKKEKLPSILRSAIIQFLKCGFEYNTLYRFNTASEMKKAVLCIKKMAAAVNNHDYTEALKQSYNMSILPQEALRVPMEYNEKGLSRALTELEHNLMVYRIDVPKRKYEFDYYWAIVKKQKDVEKSIMVRMIRCGIAVCNHASDIVTSIELRRKYEEYKKDIPVMDDLNFSAILAEQDLDRCEYEDALKRDLNSLENMKLIKKTYQRCALRENKNDTAAEYKDLARTYSATGRCVSFIANECKGETRIARQNEALQYFEKALNEFGDDKGNRMITLSHLLHLAIDIAVETNDKRVFEKYAPEYFENCSAAEWLDRNLKESVDDLFKLHLCLRSLYYLYKESNGEELSNKLSQLLDLLIRSDSDFPVELVYKYIGLLLYENSNEITRNVQKAFQHALKSIGNKTTDIKSFDKSVSLNISEIMAYQIWAIYNEKCRKQSDTHKEMKELIKRCHANGWNELHDRLIGGLPMTELLGYEYS